MKTNGAFDHYVRACRDADGKVSLKCDAAPQPDPAP
jgi:hypothetical protein